jgi:hypothetical protein
VRFKSPGQLHDLRHERVDHPLRPAVAAEIAEHHEPGLALNQHRDHQAAIRPDDQITPP